MKQASKGLCRLCQQEFNKAMIGRHLEMCRQKTWESRQHMQQKGLEVSMFHLVIEGERLPMYWLHLEVATRTTLEELDHFLREIWLECCGHLSAFTIDGLHYCADEEIKDLKGWLVGREAMQTPLGSVMHPGQSGTYEYDFGSTTALRLKVVAAYEREAPGKVLQILARNGLPPVPCTSCGQPATRVCMCCWYGSDTYKQDLEELDGTGLEMETYEEQSYLCATCAATHPHRKEDVKPLLRLNSPLAGVCGYTGPKNPIYL